MIIELTSTGEKRQLGYDVMEEIRGLWDQCFGDTEAYSEFYFNWKCKENRIYVYREDEKVVSMVQLNPYTVSVDGADVSSYYIVGVATNPAYRKRGLMRRLLCTAMEEMYEEKIPFAYLMPASESIYRPFDFRVISQQIWFALNFHKKDVQSLQYNGHCEPMQDSHQCQPDVEEAQYESMHKADSEDAQCESARKSKPEEAVCELVADFANDWMKKRYRIYTKRDAFYYQRMLAEMQTAEGGIVVCHSSDKVPHKQSVLPEMTDLQCLTKEQLQEIEGYAAYMIEDDKLQIIEAFGSLEVINELLYEICRQKGIQVEQLPLESLELQNLQSKAPSIMARIIDLGSMVELLRSEQPESFLVEIKDPILTKNSGIYQIDTSSEGGTLSKLEDFDPKHLEEEYNQWQEPLSNLQDESNQLDEPMSSEQEGLGQMDDSVQEAQQRFGQLDEPAQDTQQRFAQLDDSAERDHSQVFAQSGESFSNPSEDSDQLIHLMRENQEIQETETMNVQGIAEFGEQVLGQKFFLKKSILLNEIV